TARCRSASLAHPHGALPSSAACRPAAAPHHGPARARDRPPTFSTGSPHRYISRNKLFQPMGRLNEQRSMKIDPTSQSLGCPLHALHRHRSAAQGVDLLPLLAEGLEPLFLELEQSEHVVRNEARGHLIPRHRPRYTRRRKIRSRHAGLRERLQQWSTKRHIDPNPNHHTRRPRRLRPQLNQNPPKLAIIDQQVVRPLEPSALDAQRSQRAQAAHADHQTERTQVRRHLPKRPAQRKTDRPTRRSHPGPPAAPAPSRLVLREKHLARPIGRIRPLEQDRIARAYRPRHIQAANAIPNGPRRQMLPNLPGIQRLAHGNELVPAISNRVQSSTEVSKSLPSLPDSAPTDPQRLRQLLTRMKLSICQRSKDARNQRRLRTTARLLLDRCAVATAPSARDFRNACHNRCFPNNHSRRARDSVPARIRAIFDRWV